MKTVIINSKRPDKNIKVSPEKQFTVVEEELAVGDIWAIDEDGTIVIIAVVSPMELKGMIFDQSIINIANTMKEITPWSYLLVTGPLEDHDVIFDSAMMTLQELGVIISQLSVFATSNPESMIAPRIVKIINRDRRPKRVNPTRDFIVTTDGEALLMSLPGIGPTKTAVILNYCGPVCWALSALTDTTITTPTITNDMKNKIRHVLELEDGFMLAPVPMESKNE